MLCIAFLATVGLVTLSGCSSNRTCSVSVGTSSMTFQEADLPNNWRIYSLKCDVGAKPKVLQADDYIPGSCSQLKDVDYENFYKMQLGLLCYSGGEYDTVIADKGRLVMVSDYDHFTR